MAKFLVIVESPAKAKTINKYLGSEYVVKSSLGHIRDLPTHSSSTTRSAPIPKDISEAERESKRKQREQENLVRTMGIDPERGWQAHYEILPGKHKVLRELQQLANQSTTIFLATDLDREGEAIAWHLREAIGPDISDYKRVVFNEITRTAIVNAFAAPGDLNMERVNAQQTRRFLDRVVGYMISPLLWKKIARNLSAGRVQSVAVRLIVEREREIRTFVPEEYWKIFAMLQADPDFKARVTKYRDKSFVAKNKSEADKALRDLKQEKYIVTDTEFTTTKQNPYPPFITTTLQQAASTRLAFSIKKTMMCAQRLYEAGHITYMRTDSTNISGQAISSCRSFIEHHFGKKYLPESPRSYKSKASAQEAHEAIRPTDVNHTPEKMSSLPREEARLYELIWRQFVACQMNPAEYDNTSISIHAGDYELRATGRVIRFDGWLRVLPPVRQQDEDSELPQVRVGQILPLLDLEATQHFTQPPPRYNEASLVKELEKRGIGRPSTYAPIISTIQERGYVELVQKRFYAQKIGEIVTDRLVECFEKLLDYDFTAAMELDLDKIAQGNLNWTAFLDQFYLGFKEQLRLADAKMRPNVPVFIHDVICKSCKRPMLFRTGSTGVFLGCSGYLLPVKERCTETMKLLPGTEAVTAISETDDEALAKEILGKKRCSHCGTAMESYLVDEHRKLHICGNNPDCPGQVVEHGEFRIKGYEGPVLECDRCGAPMTLKVGRFGKFFACTRYPECKNIRKLLRNGQAAPPKADAVPMPELKCKKSDAYFVLRDGMNGIFLAAHNFPKSREVATPKVTDLVRHRSELDPKFYYLADAPQTDPEGNTALIKFNRKTKVQYLVSEKDGKETRWKAFYDDGNWNWTKK